MYVVPNRDEIREWRNLVMVAHAMFYIYVVMFHALASVLISK